MFPNFAHLATMITSVMPRNVARPSVGSGGAPTILGVAGHLAGTYPHDPGMGMLRCGDFGLGGNQVRLRYQVAPNGG